MEKPAKEWQRLHDLGWSFRAIGRHFGRQHPVVAAHVHASREQIEKNKRRAMQDRKMPPRGTYTPGVKPMPKEKKKIYVMVNNARNRARKLSVAFDLTPVYVFLLAEKQSFCCARTGIPFSYDLPQNGWKSNPYAPSLDRVDSGGGYTKDNVQLVIWALNMARSEWGSDIYERVARAYIKRIDGA